jgi:hypothetical protein
VASLSRTLAQRAFATRERRKAIPGAYPDYVDDPVALRTDMRFKRWAALLGRFGAGLDLLAALCGTDKFGMHYYTDAYDALMAGHRKRPVALLELGVGGYSRTIGGESLLMWQAYFSKGRIYGIDIEDKTALSQGRIRVFQCSQADARRLTELCSEIGPFDFVIDDGSHVNADQIASFRILWPFVKDGGAYVVEDVQTSYWPKYGGGPLGASGHPRSCMAYFKSLVDSVNAAEFLQPAPPFVDPTIGSIAFHHNLIILTKDARARASNMPLEIAELRAALMREEQG